MRSNNILAILFVLVAVSFSFGGFSDVEYFDFTGWDHGQVSGAGQVFNVAPGLDVTVTSVGSFDAPSVVLGDGMTIQSQHLSPRPGSHSFRFNFSGEERIVVATKTVDPNETHSIFSSATETYMNTGGAPATVVADGSGIAITGNGFGISDTGAAFGETLTGPTSSVTLTYFGDPTNVNKFGHWMVGRVVPEPNSIALIGIGGIGMLLQGRRRKK